MGKGVGLTKWGVFILKASVVVLLADDNFGSVEFNISNHVHTPKVSLAMIFNVFFSCLITIKL